MGLLPGMARACLDKSLLNFPSFYQCPCFSQLPISRTFSFPVSSAVQRRRHGAGLIVLSAAASLTSSVTSSSRNMHYCSTRGLDSGLRWLQTWTMHEARSSSGTVTATLGSRVLLGEDTRKGLIGNASPWFGVGSGLMESFGLKSWHQVRWSGSIKAKGKPRGPLWRQRKGVSKEALQVVVDLKRAKGDYNKEKKVLQTGASRLLKMDLLMVLVELRRQDEWSLANEIFNMVRKEDWYKPDLYLYREMMDTMGKMVALSLISNLHANTKIVIFLPLYQEVERLLKELQEEGLSPDVMILTELMGAYVRSGNISRAYEVYEEIKRSEMKPEQITYEIICRGLRKAREFKLMAQVMEDCAAFSPDLAVPFSKQMLEPSVGTRCTQY